MKQLFTLDLKNYTDDMPVVEKSAVRAIIFRGGKMAMQQSGKGEYKIPGGGMEAGESKIETLIREVREETGLIVIPSPIEEIGEILEIREDVFNPGHKYICRSYFYFCNVENTTIETQMTESEIAKGFHPVWEYPEVICEVNDKLQSSPWQKRDTEFVRMLADGRVKIPENYNN